MGVDVAADGGDGGDAGEFGEDRGVAYVAGVEDVVDAGEGGKEFWAKKAVGVGDDADEHARGLGHDARGLGEGGCGGPGSRGDRRR